MKHSTPSRLLPRQLAQLMSLSCFVVIAANGAANRAVAQLPTIELTSLSRSAGQVGSTFEIQLNGGRLDELQTLVFSKAPAGEISATGRTTSPRLLSDQPTPTNTFDGSIAAGATPGLVEVRGLGRFGLSNPRRFLITSKRVEVAGGDHSGLATPLAVPAAGIVLDRCAPQQRNFFRIEIPAGGTLRCVAYAQQLDSQASLNMRLLDAQGEEIARSRSTGAWPAEIEHTGKEAAEVFIAVHDVLYRGGSEFPFVLEAVATPAESEPLPLELDQLLRPKLSPVKEESAALAQQQPGDRTPPFAVRGSFGEAENHVDFVAQAQQALSLRVTSSQADQLTDPRLVVYKLAAAPDSETAAAAAPAALVQLAEQDDAPFLGAANMRLRRTDPALLWTAPEDATYRIVLADNQAGARPADATEFELTVGEPRPGFRLIAFRPLPTNTPAAARPFGSNLMRGGTESIHVIALRQDGYMGKIELSVENLPPGLSCAPMIMAAGADDSELILRAADDAPAWHGELKIVGRANVDEQPLEAIAEAATILWPATPTRNAVQNRRSNNLMAAINAVDIAPLLVELGDGGVIEAAQGAKAIIPIKATRREGGQAECLLRPQQLPPGTTLGEIKLPADQSELTAELAIAADAPLGESTLWMQNETKIKFKPNPQALEREEAYLSELKTALEAATEEAEKLKLNEAITATSALVEERKKQAAEQEFTVWLPTTPQRIRIVAASN